MLFCKMVSKYYFNDQFYSNVLRLQESPAFFSVLHRIQTCFLSLLLLETFEGKVSLHPGKNFSLLVVTIVTGSRPERSAGGLCMHRESQMCVVFVGFVVFGDLEWLVRCHHPCP